MSSGTDVDRLPIERAQREYQGRHEVVYNGRRVGWPSCSACTGAPAPAYPKDKFYGEQLSHAQQFALVQDLRNKFWDSVERIWPAFVKDDLVEGWSDLSLLPAFDDVNDFPYISDAELTIESYPAVFRRIHSYIRKLKALEVSGGQVGISDEVAGEFRDGSDSGDTCEDAQGAALSAWDENPWWEMGNGNWYPHSSSIQVKEGAGAAGYPLIYSAFCRSTRGRLRIDLRRFRQGSATCYIYVAPQADGASNGPPAPADNAWHAYSGASLGSVWHSPVLGDQKPTFTVGCPVDVYETKGWVIVRQVAIVKPRFRTRADSVDCDGCGQLGCRLGDDAASSQGSLQYTIGLGHTSEGDFAGWVWLDEDEARPGMAQLPALRWSADAEVQITTDGAGALRQAKSPQGLLDVVADASNAYRYYLRFYKSSQVGAMSGGVYPIVSGEENNWYRQVTVENPDFVPGQPLGAYNRLKISSHDGPSPGTLREMREFSYDAGADAWSLLSGWDAAAGQYLRWESKSTTWNTGQTERTETSTARNNSSTGAVVSNESNVYQVFGWAEERIRHHVDPDGANLTTTWTYYTDPLDTNNYGRLKQVDGPSGYWEKYSYDASGRRIKTVSQYQNRPNTAGEADSVVVERAFEAVDVLDWSGRPGPDGYVDLRETIIEKVGGSEVARSYRIVSGEPYGYDYQWDVRCPAVGAAWNDAANQVTITKSNKYGASSLAGKVLSVVRANGDATAFYRTTVHDYSSAAESHPYLGTLKVMKLRSGTPAAWDPESVWFGTEAVTKRHSLGEVVFKETYPIDSGVTDTATAIASEVVPADAGNDYLDDFGQVERTNYLDGTYATTTYSNGRLSSRRDRQALVTDYAYDSLGRATSEARAVGTSGQLVMLYGYDAEGRLTQLKRKGTDNAELVVETLTYDVAGRKTGRTDALGKNSYFTYHRYTDSGDGKTYDESRAYPHNNASGPVQVTWQDGEGQGVRSFNGTTATDWAPNPPSGSEMLTELSRSEFEFDWRGRQTKERQYHDIASLLYYETTNTYDNLDRLLRTRDGMGNVAAHVYDQQDRAVSEWRGTSDTAATADNPAGSGSPNDMVKVSDTFYDTNRNGTGEDRPFATRTTRPRPISTLSLIATDFDYDSRRRREWTKPSAGAGPWVKTTYDLGNRVLDTIAHTNGSTTFILTQSSNAYDSLGRQTTTKQHEVNGSGGLTGNALQTRYDYDAANRRVKVSHPAGGFSKTLFDPVSRVKTEAFCSAEGADTNAETLTDDTVVETTEFSYDAVDNVTQATHLARNHDAGATGPLTTSAARVSYQCSWYDDAHRVTHAVNYGTNGGASFTRPSTPPEPDTSDDYIVQKTVYDGASRVKDSVNNRGIITRFEYDALDRMTRKIENHADGIPGNDNDRITVYAYNADGNVTSLTADMPSGTPDQTTTYVYSAGLTDKGSVIKSNSYLRAIVYPASDDGVSGGVLGNGADNIYDRVEFTYHADGSLAARKDQRQVTLSFSYDDAGRRTEQKVTAGTVDGDQQIKYTYTSVGQPDKLTGYSVSDTTITSEVKFAYNGLGQVTTEYQEHAGVVNTGTSPKVQYGFDSTAAAGVLTKGRRPTSMTYPNGRILRFEYNSGIDDATSRVSLLADDNAGAVGTHLEEYAYLGRATIVKRAHAEPGVDLTYIKQTGEPNGPAGDQYAGLDRFGRVIDQRWRKLSVATDLDRFAYGYDRNGNRTSRDVIPTNPPSNLDEAYLFDGLDRLVRINRGTLSGGTIGDSAAAWSKAWALDALGNWGTLLTDTDPPTAASGETTVTRIHDQRNRIVSISQNPPPNPTLPLYDANGNTTRADTGHQYVYDAWDRLTAVKDAAGSTLVSYRYDGFNRRILEQPNAGIARNLFYSWQHQVVEERESNAAKRQYVWLPHNDGVLILRDSDADNHGSGGLEERLYVSQDAEGRATSLIGVAGSVLERYLHEAYAAFAVLTPAWASRAPSQYGWIYLLGAARFDSATGLHILGGRDVSPSLGRWIEWDLWEYDEAMNPYLVSTAHNSGTPGYPDAQPEVAIPFRGVAVGAAPVGMALDQSAAGSTRCDPLTGRIIVQIFDTSCTRRCTREHEEVHRRQLQTCCRSYAKCVARRGFLACQSHWSSWFWWNEPRFECEGYKKSASCMKGMMLGGCFTCVFFGIITAVFGRLLSKECCEDLKAGRENDEFEVKFGYCKQQQRYRRCPFNLRGFVQTW